MRFLKRILPDEEMLAIPAWIMGIIAVAVPLVVAATALFALMVMTFFDVILRSVFNDPIESATEMTRIFMAIVVFSALPVISWRGDHIIVDLLDPLFGRMMARLRDIVIDIACGVLLIWPALRVWELAERSAMFGDRTEYMQMPTHYIEYFIAIFTMLTALTFIVRGIARIVAPSRIPS